MYKGRVMVVYLSKASTHQALCEKEYEARTHNSLKASPLSYSLVYWCHALLVPQFGGFLLVHPAHLTLSHDQSNESRTLVFLRHQYLKVFYPGIKYTRYSQPMLFIAKWLLAIQVENHQKKVKAVLNLV